MYFKCVLKRSFLIFSAECRESLGMQSGEIPDKAITASSSYDDGSVGPQNARYDNILSLHYI